VSVAAHWKEVWTEKDPEEVSWFEATPGISLEMIDALELPAEAPILDVGGGASSLAAELLDRGHSDITVTDISGEALAREREALGERARDVEWLVADVRDHDLGRRFALWHDRALFHFMTDTGDREAYLATLARSVEPGGHLIVAGFGPDAPTTCSGLPVSRYAADELAQAFEGVGRLVSSRLELHRTPSGGEQQFLYALLAATRR